MPSASSRLRTVAFYLPQYHRIPENDEWWGEGFTDWDQLARARPRFRGHPQPDLPGELGQYDLRDPSARLAQATMAQRYGVDAFCHYHYWFSGKQLFHEPLRQVLANDEPEHPFCLCWANEAWTRAWDGGHKQVLIGQSYSRGDDAAHGRWLSEVFADPRYLRVDGRPVFLVYKASELPDARRTTEMWREIASRSGLGDLFLCRVECQASERGDPTRLGFDASVEFAPTWGEIPATFQSLVARALRDAHLPPSHIRFDYRKTAERSMRRPLPNYLRFPCVMPGWDNSPRRKRGAVIFTGSSPTLYARWLAAAAEKALQVKAGDSLLFVNAWNEWAEGAHLEPGLLWGTEYLQAHREVVDIVKDSLARSP